MFALIQVAGVSMNGSWARLHKCTRVCINIIVFSNISAIKILNKGNENKTERDLDPHSFECPRIQGELQRQTPLSILKKGFGPSQECHPQ